MKVKGIPFWEQHLEHFVLGLAVLVFVGFAATQFMGSPNAVTVQGKTYTPQNVDELLREKAEQIAAQLNNPTSGAKLPDPPQLMPQFQERLQSPISPARTLLALGPNISPSTAGGEVPTGQPFVVAQVPAPTLVNVTQIIDTLTEETVSEHPDLAKVVPQTPRDITATTVAGMFKVGDVLKQFSGNGPNGESPLPNRWYNGRVDFIDVKVFREELVGDAWTGRTLIDHIPGQYDLRPTLAKPIDRAIASDVLNKVADVAIRQDITQPEFYQGKASAWTAPALGAPDAPAPAAADPAVGAPENERVASLKRKLKGVQRELDRLKKQMEAINCSEPSGDEPEEPKKDKPSGSSGDSGSGGGARSGGRPGSGMGGSSGGGARERTSDGKCKQYQEKHRALSRRIKEMTDEITKLQPADAPAPVVDETKPADEAPDELLVWAHDIQVVPGHTYRYQLVVEVFNPLFGHKADLIKEQHALADQFVLASAPSEWTQPITIQPAVQLFVTAARVSQEQQAAAPDQSDNATVEVFRFHDGRWWQETFSVEPGDRIGGQGDSKGGAANAPVITFDTEWFLLDVVPLTVASREEQNQGVGATALLQSMRQVQVVATRDPRADKASLDRRRLQDEVEAAKVAETVAAAE